MKEVGFVATMSVAVVLIAGLIVFLAVQVYAQEATSTPSPTSTEGVNVQPDGTPILTGSSTQEVADAANAVHIPTFAERIADITNPDVLLLVEQKKTTDDLASKYAKLYDSCRFGR